MKYQEEAQNTEAPVDALMQDRAAGPVLLGLLRVGFEDLITVGGFLDALKRHLFYGKNLEEKTLAVLHRIEDGEVQQRTRMFVFLRLLHAVIGIATEAGELAEQLFGHLFFGRPLDQVHIEEELGDILWYVALACNALGVDMQKVMDMNIAKLRKRYPDKFTSYDALNRNLATERDTLERGSQNRKTFLPCVHGNQPDRCEMCATGMDGGAVDADGNRICD